MSRPNRQTHYGMFSRDFGRHSLDCFVGASASAFVVVDSGSVSWTGAHGSSFPAGIERPRDARQGHAILEYCRRSVTARADSARGYQLFCETLTMTPNKSPEPTRIGAVSCPQGFQWFHIAGSGWLSFFR